MKNIVGKILSGLVIITMSLGIFCTGLFVYVSLFHPLVLNVAGMLIWAAISIALTFLLMVAVIKWG